jgi:hypothetical protein
LVFSELRPLKEPLLVSTAKDNSTCFATGFGVIIFVLDSGHHLKVHAFYVPDFGVCLLSVDVLNDSGYSVIFRPGLGCFIIGLESSNSVEIPLGRRRDKSRRGCRLLGRPIVSNVIAATAHVSDLRKTSSSSSSSTAPSLQTWHQRLGHLNYTDLRSMLNSDQYSGSMSNERCEVCLTAKAKEHFQRRVPSTRATKPLQLIHSDVCGPISPPSLSGFRYYIVYIDDYSRYTWIYFLRTKNSPEVVSVFNEFKAKVELEFQEKIYKVIHFRSDNGKGEYDNQLFRQVLTQCGISFEPAPPYTQHKNGVSERMIQTHNVKGRAMMIESDFPDTLWADIRKKKSAR